MFIEPLTDVNWTRIAVPLSRRLPLLINTIQ